MIEILKTLPDTPLPSILVVGGLVFLLLPFLKKTGGAIEIESANKGVAAIIGIFLLASGIALYILPLSAQPVTDTNNVAISTSQPTQGSIVIATATIQQITRQSNAPTPTVATGYIPTCNWTRDWALQPDGSYLWIGYPPGTPECQNVGQAGELLQRLRNGENIKLVVNIGDNFVGLNICKGKYTATQVIPGEICVPKNPELWPKVKGTLVVTESDGFSVGTGR